jgi:glyoxylase-like metal-dependent hydrolase (beta-lactamase superfamily II)
MVYALDLGALVLIDCGAGPGWPRIRDEMVSVGLQPEQVHTLVLTHGHVDHIGAAHRVRAMSGCRVVAHQGDLGAIQSGDPVRTAAAWYDLELPGCPVDHVMTGERETLSFPRGDLALIHAPGHTPGSLVALTILGDRRVLFGQDIHGPFHPDFGSDLARWRESMATILALEADLLCEGHFGVFQPAARARRFIEGQLSAHEK